MTVSETTSIRDQRLRKGLTLRKLADACAAGGASVHYSQLARIERGLYTPRPELRAVLAKVLELEITDFEREAS